MGISTLQSYRGAQVFEAIGLNKRLVDEYFTGTASRIEGVGLDVLARRGHPKHRHAFQPHHRIGDRAGSRRQLSVPRARRISPVQSADHLQAAARGAAAELPDVPGIHGPHRQAEPPALHAARTARAQDGRRARAARRSGAGHGNRQALRHRRHVVRLDLQGSARDAGHRHEPHRRQVQHRRRRRRRSALRATNAPQRRSSRWPRRASASPPITWSTPTSCRSRWRRAPSPAKAASFPATKWTRPSRACATRSPAWD